MLILRELRKRMRFVAGPALGIALTGYFVYHLIEGDHGLLAWLRLTRELREETAKLETVRGQRTALDVKVANLKPEHIDPDLLDEQARIILNLVAPDEIVIMQHPPPR